jgi:hypothetical protein
MAEETGGACVLAGGGKVQVVAVVLDKRTSCVQVDAAVLCFSSLYAMICA